MGNIGITIVNTVILLVFLACAGNLIVGGLLNAIRESKGKPKKKRTSLIIFDIAMMAVCLGVFSIMQRNEPAESSEPEEAVTWYGMYTVYDTANQRVAYERKLKGSYASLDDCKQAMVYENGWRTLAARDKKCGKNCSVVNNAMIESYASCKELVDI